ncbi:glycosyltransferase family 1 protein [Suhomyces tanzawaensis NRRL Y-17324]|uniref:UDP-N-acetylglucosamine transferase subunit ALG13 n=1 Tax=Suhomyces tanzawaensis NRRL Y-17324 TaxID=984487 RepID=A0A1E4SAY7_9ASCO|nr:glycosyltransferase family 1 protein [Suhomyces tanzawaensis NRRL Y-17324]ODV76661.1 glycosyltransferase family 1 protein [Suhomyces tanzawaensis NRRL Y-17324]
MATVLVTTGATVTFTRLLETVLTPEFIRQLIANGVSTLIIQYGNEIKNGVNLSSKVFHSLLTKHQIVSSLGLKAADSNDQIETYSSSQFTLVALPFSPTISKYIDQADVVVSHAGTGSIVDVLRADKKLIAVVNDELMDNHQAEVAHEFAQLNYCLHSENQAATLILHIKLLLHGLVTLIPFPPQQKHIVQSILFQEANK